MKKWVLGLILTLCLTVALPVMALADAPSIQMGTSALEKGQGVYLGQKLWLVLDENGGNTFVLSKYLLGTSVFRNGNGYYAGSALNAKMDDLYNGAGSLFTVSERGAILGQTNLSCVDGSADDPAAPVVPTAHLYPLSSNEVIALGEGSAILKATQSDDPFGDTKPWWLRSSHDITDPYGVRGNEEGSALEGTIGVWNWEFALGVRPAFHVDSSKVLFASAAVGGKTGNGVSATLAEVPATSPSEWRLTLADSSRGGFAASRKQVTNNVLTFEYSGAATGENEFISAIIQDTSGAITHYGRILSPASAEGTATINLPADMNNKTLYVFSEQYNGDQKTDYASPLRAVNASSYDITISPNALFFNYTYGEGTFPAAQTVTITNTGNQSVRVRQPSSWAGYTVTRGEGFVNGTATLAKNGSSAVFTVQPNANLPIGWRNESYIVSGTPSVAKALFLSSAVKKPAATMEMGSSGISEGDKVFFGKFAKGGSNYDVSWLVVPSKALKGGFAPSEMNVQPLLSEYLLGDSRFRAKGDSGYYHTTASGATSSSILKKTMEDYYNGANKLFTAGEQSAIADTELDDMSMGWGVNVQPPNLPRQKLFPLCKTDIYYLGARNTIMKATYIDNGSAGQWCLRFGSNGNSVGSITADGTEVLRDFVGNDLTFGVRPAFNFDLSKLLFSSAATGGKSAAGMDGGIAAVSKNDTGAWKLTLLDSRRNGFSVTSTRQNGNLLTIGYSGAATGANEYISAIIQNADGAIAYYGRVARASSASGSVQIDLSGATIAATDTLYLFSEQYNGEKTTDYASKLTPINAPIVIALSVSPKTASVTKGTKQLFSATVSGMNNPSQAVTWSVSGNASTATVISTNGELTVALDETAASLTVTATSVADTSKSDAAIVTVTEPLPTVDSVSVLPSRVEVVRGTTQGFAATVTGANNPPQTVTWSITGNNSLSTVIGTDGTLSVAANETAASLTVTATSTYNTSKYGTAAVALLDPPPTVTAVTVEPATAIVVKGETQRFTAAVSGTNNPPQAVAWSVADGSAAKAVRLSSVTAIDASGLLTIGADETAKTLIVTATSNFDQTKSGAATVAVRNPATAIVITLQPTGQRVTEGQRAVFSLAAEGDGLTYQWSIDRNDGAGWRELDGATSASYTTSVTVLANNGFRYRCTIEDASGATRDSDIAALRVVKAVIPPKTGDSATPLVWLGLCLLGGAGLLALTLGRRRRA